MSALVLAASLFVVVHPGIKAKLEISPLHVMEAAERIFRVRDFHYYAQTDGIKEILTKAGRGIRTREKP